MNETKTGDGFETLDLAALGEVAGGNLCEWGFRGVGGALGAWVGSAVPGYGTFIGGYVGQSIGAKVGEYACNVSGYEYTGQESLWTGAP